MADELFDGNLALANNYCEEQPTELLNGVAVAMAPHAGVWHSDIVDNIHEIFRSYLKGKKCRAFGDNVDLYLDDKNWFVPDVMVVCDRDKIKSNGVHGAPDLVVEVLSPGTARNDKGYKKKVYEACGVKEYWLVSPFDRLIDVYLLKDGKFELDAVYGVVPDYMLARMSDKQRAGVIKEFKCSLFDDLIIKLDDVFYEA